MVGAVLFPFYEESEAPQGSLKWIIYMYAHARAREVISVCRDGVFSTERRDVGVPNPRAAPPATEKW